MKSATHLINHLKMSLYNIRWLLLTGRNVAEFAELTVALQKREYKIENTINRLRMAGISLIIITDVIMFLLYDLHATVQEWIGFSVFYTTRFLRWPLPYISYWLLNFPCPRPASADISAYYCIRCRCPLRIHFLQYDHSLYQPGAGRPGAYRDCTFRRYQGIQRPFFRQRGGGNRRHAQFLFHGNDRNHIRERGDDC